MTQDRLNSVVVCSVHHDYIDHLDLKDLVNAFASQNDRRHCLENFDVAVDL